jgi:ketosteroid isomerase-like protein
MQNPLRISMILAVLSTGVGLHPVLAAPAAATLPSASAARAAEAEVLARERAWLDAVEHNDADVIAEILADDFVLTIPDGRTITKADVVARRRQPRAPNVRHRLTTSGVVAHVREGVVVLVGRVFDAATEADGKTHTEEAVYTDTWVRDGATWHALSSQMTHPAAKP